MPATIILLLGAIAALTLSILLSNDWSPEALDAAKLALATAGAVVVVWSWWMAVEPSQSAGVDSIPDPTECASIRRAFHRPAVSQEAFTCLRSPLRV